MTTFYNALGNVLPSKTLRNISANNSAGSSDTGKTINFTASSAITFTFDIDQFLVPVNAVAFQSATTNHALVTLDSDVGTISGQSTVVVGVGDRGIIYTPDGNNAFLESLFLQPANFRSYLSSNGTLPATGSSLTILFNTEVRDIGGFYAVGTGIWTPLLPGVGLSGGQVIVDFDGSENTVITCQLQKNGSAISTDIQQGAITAARQIKFSVFDGDINFNGSTDNYKIVISQTGANTQTILGTIDQTFFYGSRTGLF